MKESKKGRPPKSDPVEKYGLVYLTGMGNTLLLAVITTLIGCVIGFFCGIMSIDPGKARAPRPSA